MVSHLNFDVWNIEMSATMQKNRRKIFQHQKTKWTFMIFKVLLDGLESAINNLHSACPRNNLVFLHLPWGFTNCEKIALVVSYSEFWSLPLSLALSLAPALLLDQSKLCNRLLKITTKRTNIPWIKLQDRRYHGVQWLIPYLSYQPPGRLSPCNGYGKGRIQEPHIGL